MISQKFKRFLSESKESRMSLREAKRICENAGYKVRFNESESEYTVRPKTKKELQKIIKKTIKEQGPECDLNFIDTSLITDMSYLFAYNFLKFNGDISKWDVSNVEDMSHMFEGAISFNRPIGNWDVSNVENMSGMFCYAESFNQPIGNWNVSNVRYMGNMFLEAISFNQSIGNWDVSNVKKMESMLRRAFSFDQPLDKWDVSSVKNMDFMFREAKSFNQDIEDWDVSNVWYMNDMFDKSPLENNPPSWYEED